jgi:trimeric autotransporter adhesin
MKTNTLSLILIPLLIGFAFLQPVQAVVPPPDGGYPNFTTAEGTNALKNLTTGAANTAVGWFSLFGDTTASFNTGVGAGTLLFNNGDQNTAVGVAALLSNTIGSFNTATGVSALSMNTTGTGNTATGDEALINNTTGTGNTALGWGAGTNLTTGDGNVCIGWAVVGVAGESDTTRIRNIWGRVGGTQAVYVDEDGRLGANTSSRRFKEEIRPMDTASEVIYSLKPVSFRYKREIERTRPLSFGLIAEDVEQINADLVLRGKDGKVSTVRYEAVNAMLLNEFLKEHRKVEQQQATITQLKKDLQTVSTQQRNEIQLLSAQLREQGAQIQKVSAQLEASKPAPRVVKNP